MADLPELIADPYGPFHGPLAHAFACAVHIAVDSGAPWNAVDRGCACCDAKRKRKTLQEDWGIASSDDWRKQQEALLDEDGSNGVAAMLLSLRTGLARQYGRAVDARTWREAIKAWSAQAGHDVAVYQRLLGEAGMILDYEKRFIADGLLPPGTFVTSINAWDSGRGANMARWGVHCRYTDLPTSQWYAVRASEVARRNHASWTDFSAGYILGRCLHFDQGEFGWRYTDALAVHRVMTTHPQSPWLNMPFHI
ncbi:DUF1266 domain-containing protein [Nocardiopsis trehalosi]|jgi:hypothetical protein|uniref:DUF1266 domain-containing protein n=1 Tax=Nocardiopsis trehalosi TaxID=109329 RepID=UPI00082FA3DB|nr:DUF1266 domain-containing protein [Nocardiopsis trehalosi]